LSSSDLTAYPAYKDLFLWPVRYAAGWKQAPDDFRVDEVWAPDLDPKGEHILLRVSKRGQNTHWVAREVARFAGVRDFDVAYMGMKDRQAVTTQYFSVYLGNRPLPDWSALELPDVSIIPAGRISKKLRRGDHAGNRFRIVLHFSAQASGGGLDAVAVSDIEKKLGYLRQHGYPNAFGLQRFGRNDDNVARADLWLGTRKRHRDRHLQGVYLSAVRSAFFNAVLKERIRQDCWNMLISGDKPVPAAECSLLYSPRRQCLVPAGTLPGDTRFAEGRRGELEKQTAQPCLRLLEGLHAMGVRAQNRPLVARCDDLNWEWQGVSRLTLSITLGTGCYASTLLEQLFILDASDEDAESED
jgi:tRNA pseudouridine13 synthase